MLKVQTEIREVLRDNMITECPLYCFACYLKTFVLGYILLILSLILFPTTYVSPNFKLTFMTWLISTNESRKE